MGIVFLQVEVLKLGASVGRDLQRTTALQSRNDLLRANVASLADDQRIERAAAGMGMVMPAPEAIGFLRLRADGNATQAAHNIHPSNPSSFASLASSNGAVVTGGGASDSGSTSSGSSSGSSSDSGTTSSQPTGG